jgi:hypothetical protein
MAFFSRRFEGGGLALTLTAAEKKLAGQTATVNVKGKLENVNTTFQAVMNSGKLQQFAYMTPMSGTVDVTTLPRIGWPTTGLAPLARWKATTRWKAEPTTAVWSWSANNGSDLRPAH